MIMFITISHKIRRKGERKWWSCGKVLVLFPTLPLSDFHSSFFSTWIGLKNGSTFWKRYFMIITIIVIYQQCLLFFQGYCYWNPFHLAAFGDYCLPYWAYYSHSVLEIYTSIYASMPLAFNSGLTIPRYGPTLYICKSVPTTKFCSVFRLLFSCTY